MSLLTMIGRVPDGLLLAGSQDNDPSFYAFQKQGKDILKSLGVSSPPRCTIDAHPNVYYYIIEDFVCYITMAPKGFPSALAYQYLDALNRQFQMDHAHELQRFSRPYAAIKFDTKMNRLRRQFTDPRAPQNVDRVNQNLHEVRNIMHKNITEVLQRGEKLDRIQDLSDDLKHNAKKFAKSARWVNITAMYKAYLPFVVVLLVILLVLWMKFG